MAKYEVTVGAERLNPKKKRVFLKVLFSLIFGILIGGGLVYYYYNYYLDKTPKKEEKKTTTTKTKTTKTKETTLDINNYEVKRLINEMHYSEFGVIEKTLYIEDKTVAKDLDSNYLDNLLLLEAYRTKTNFTDSVTIKDLEQARKNIFGTNYEIIIPTDKEIGDCPTFKYDVTTRTYSKNNTICDITSEIEIRYLTTKATKKEKEYISIYEKVAFISEDKVYKKIDGSNNLTEEVEVKDINDFEIKDYKDELNEYKYNFKYDEDTDNYIFESIELVK